MTIKHAWLVLPSDELIDRHAWQSLNEDRFATLRAFVLITKSRGASRLGVPVAEHNVAPGDTVVVEQSRERTESNELAISSSIQSSFSSRVCQAWTAKVGAGLKASVPGYESSLASELQSTTTREVIEGLQQSLSATSSHKIQVSETSRHAITLTGNTAARVATLRRRYWPEHWDIYLYFCDYLELRHRRNWSFFKIRETIERTSSGVLGWPICRLTFYTPQENIDVTYSPVPDEIEAPEAVAVSSVPVVAPSLALPPSSPLEHYASLAFPGSRLERKVAAKAKKAPAKKAAAKKAPAKKAAAKKAPAKKAAAKKAPAKKAAG